jgi:oxygen-independent coproporphyrinogen-3 oxidase
MTDKIEFFDQIELYLHIPFCVKKCAYCDFLSFPAGREEQSAYVEALLDEINKSLERGRATTIFFGGGTPSLLPGEEISRIMDAIRKKYEISADAEITLEANPGTITLEKLRAWKGAGINRLSMGLQSTENEELRNLGRIHTCEVFLQGYEMARTAGFENINIDLMSSLPGQSPESWRRTLKRVVDLEPEHISAYSLIIEEGTPFYDLYEEDVLRRERGETSILLPTEEEERQMYYDTKEILETYGYHRYEISNYAKTGYECRHNCGYWKRVNYRGYGLGASSLLDNVRFKNTSDLQKYLNREFLREEEEILTDREQMAEFMFLGLRLMEGISRHEFEETFGRPYDAVY